MNKSAEEILKQYMDEDLPEFSGIILKDINQHGNFDNTPLHIACTRGNLEEVTTLIESGADINARGELGNTPLHDAAGQGFVEVVKFLLNFGANPAVLNEHNNTPRDVALLMHNNQVASILEGALKKGSA